MPNFRAIGLFSGEFNMKNITNSDWKAIRDFPDYAITPDGQVWSFKSKRFLKPQLDRKGYLRVDLYNDLKRKICKIHRLVGMAFVKLPEEFNGNYDIATIDHIDGNKENNHYTNLEWVTREENASRAWENGLCDDKKKECFCVSIEDKKYTPFNSAREIDESLNLPKDTVSKAISRAGGIIQGKYIVGYTEDLDQKYLSPKPDAVGIIQLYSKAIANYTPSKNPCSYIDSLDNSYHESESISDIDKKLNLPIGTAKQAIRRNHGLIRGRYIAGCLNDRRWRGLITKCTVEQIVESYAKKIERYKQRGPRKITNLETGESETYESLADFAREKGIHPKNASKYLKNHPDLYKVELA